MIHVIDYHNSTMFRNSQLLDDMFLARCKAFTDRLGWVPSMNDREVDQFDTIRSQPTYMIVTNPNGQYEGSVRLVDTDKPNMLANVFPHLIPSHLIPASIDFIEMSRIHMLEGTNAPRKRGINVYLGELFVGLGTYMYKFDYDKMVTVVDERMLRVLKIAGTNPELLHPEGFVEPDGIKSFVVWIHRESLDNVKKMFNIDNVII
jgi:N-acyl-L-homoserine lactone synthetase